MRTVHGLLDLSGRVALVTGGAGHIGSAIAEALAECGAHLMLVDMDRERARLVCRDISDRVGRERAVYSWTDLQRSEAARYVATDVADAYGRLDILVNCAAYLDGPGLDVPFEQQTVEAWDRSFAVNVRAPFLLAQACAPLLRASGHGAIINVASIYGVVAHQPALYAGTDIYCGLAYQASKAALLQLTRGLAVELAPSVRVNAIVPGGIAREQDAAFVERYCEQTPLGRLGKEEDIKGVCAWLASDASAYVTGQCIGVEGGWLAW